MIFTEEWLRQYVNPALGTDELADALTMAGLEVEEVRTIAPAFSGVVVGGGRRGVPPLRSGALGLHLRHLAVTSYWMNRGRPFRS